MNKTDTLKAFIANRVRIIRKSKKISQEELSEKAYLDIKYINKLENLRNNIKTDTLEQILNALDISYQDFFNFNNISNEDDQKISLLLKQLPSDKRKQIYSAIIILLENYLE